MASSSGEYAISSTANYVQGGLYCDIYTSGGTCYIRAYFRVRRTNSYSGTTYTSSATVTVTVGGQSTTQTIGITIPGNNTSWIDTGVSVTASFTGGEQSCGVSWSSHDNVGSYFTGSGSATLTTIATYIAPSGLGVSLSSVTTNSATFYVTLDSYGSPNDGYIEAGICSTATYTTEPRRYAPVHSVRAATITVGNSGVGTLSIQPNTRYYYGAYASNRQLNISVVPGQFATLAASPTIVFSSQVYATKKTVNATIAVTSPSGGGANARNIQSRYSTNGGSSYSSWSTVTTLSGSTTSGSYTISGLPTSTSVIVQARVNTSAGTNTTTSTITFTTFDTVVEDAKLSIVWNDLRRRGVITATCSDASAIRLTCGYTNKGTDIDDETYIGTSATLAVNELLHGEGQRLFVNAVPLNDAGDEMWACAAQASYLIPNPIIGVVRENDETSKYVVDMVEKRSNGEVTSQWQTGERAYVVQAC